MPNLHRHAPAFVGVLLLAIASAASAAATSVRSGDAVVHASAIAAAELDPGVARRLGIPRAAGRALLQVTVRRGEPGRDQAVAAQVSANASVSGGSRNRLRLREVREGGGVYYLAETSIDPRHPQLRFEIEVRLPGRAPIRAFLRQEFLPR